MAAHRIKQGLDLPIEGAPEQKIEDASQPPRVALVAADYIGMKPTMHVQEGDTVQLGQLLFEDKKTPGVRYTSPASGKVVGVHRGARRALQSVVVELSDDELAGKTESIKFESDTGKHPSTLSHEQVRDLLVESGLWTALRTRPYSKVPSPDSKPNSLFVTAMDTHPLAPEVDAVMAGREDDFERGLVALGKLTDGKVYVCAAPGTSLKVPSEGRFERADFSGPHPAGTAGVHIHTLDPVDRNKTVWHIGYQDVLAVGKLFADGRLDVTRVVSLAGPPVGNPRLLRTRIGASTDHLTDGEIAEGENRIISGSVLDGRAGTGDVHGYLGRYANQVSVLREGRERELLGWMGPGSKIFSIIPLFLSKLSPNKKYAFSTTTNGSVRAIVPIGVYEKVFPFDIPPSFLMRSLAVQDLEFGEQLGALELDEEDVALCSFVCPGKLDYGDRLREMLTILEKEG